MRTVAMSPSSPLVSANPCDLPMCSSSGKKEAGWGKKKRQGPSVLNKGNETQLTKLKQYREGVASSF